MKLGNLLESLLFLERCRICRAYCAFVAKREPGVKAEPKAVCKRCWAEIVSHRPTLEWRELDRDLAFPIASGSAYKGHLKKLIYHLKYDGDRLLAQDMAWLIVAAWQRIAHELGDLPALIVPIPLHADRLRSRGYNQAELVAKHAAGPLGLKVLSCALTRKRPTVAQHGLGRQERMLNLRGAFACEPWLVSGKVIILIDDVFTTGATLCEAARILMAAGALKVIALTAARANPAKSGDQVYSYTELSVVAPRAALNKSTI